MTHPKKPVNRTTGPRQAVVRQFEAAMALMSIIPMLGFVYLMANIAGLDVFARPGGFLAFSLVAAALIGIMFSRALIANVVKELEIANHRLESASEMKTAFLRNVAHEAATPLATARGNLIALRDSLHGGISEEARPPIAATLRQVDRLRRMVKELLDIAQIEKGTFPMNWKRTDLTEALNQAVETVRGVPDAAEHAGIRWEPDVSHWLERADSDRLVQVAVNLLRNAQKYGPSDGQIELEADGGADFYTVRVLDRGEGVPDAMKEKIFEPFIRGSEKDVPGVGLGLPISRHIVQLHGGRLWVEDRPGGGAVFAFRLPKNSAP